MTAAQTIAEWATTLTADDVPEDVAEHAKLHFLDTIGCGYAASALGVATEGRTTMAELGGEPQASVIGLDGALPAPNAAFANGMLCHGLDFDDTHADSVSHVSVVVCPASLADRGGAGLDRRGAPDRDRRGQRDRHARRLGRVGRSSMPAASTRPRSAGSSAARPPRRG